VVLHHADWHVGFEFAATRKDYNVIDAIFQVWQVFLERKHMGDVLVEGILKLVFHLASNGLSPLILVLAAKNPASIILAFNHKNPKPRNHNVVDLAGD